MKLAYQRWNNNRENTKIKITLLHGMGGTGALWRPIAAALENDCDILAPDQRSHGKSQISFTPGSREEVSYTPLDYGKDLVETLDELKFYPTWLIGHSMGVRTACAAAHLKPEWICGLVLVDLGFSGEPGGGLGSALAAFVKKLPTEFSSRAEARTFMNENCPDPAIAQYLMAVSGPTPTGGITFPFDHSALIQTIHAAKNASVRKWVHELGERGMPILALRGANSLVWSHEEFETEKKEFAKYPSIIFEEIAGAGHGLPFEQRQEFVKRVVGFVAKN